MAKYRKKPVVIDAIQLVVDPNDPDDAGNSDEISDFLGDNLIGFSDSEVHYKNSLHGSVLYTYVGEWIILGNEQGDFYPCKPDVFELTYEKVEE